MFRDPPVQRSQTRASQLNALNQALQQAIIDESQRETKQEIEVGSWVAGRRAILAFSLASQFSYVGVNDFGMLILGFHCFRDFGIPIQRGVLFMYSP